MVNKNSRFDKLADKKYTQFKRRGLGFAAFELMYVRRDLHHMQAQHAEKILAVIETNFAKMKGTPEDNAVYSLLKGSLLRQLNQVSNAKDCFKKIVSLDGQIKEEMWCLPNALQELAEIYYFEGNLDETEKLLKQGLKYNNYDWQDVVSNRIKISLQTVKKDKQKRGETVTDEKLTPTTEEKEIEEQLDAMKVNDEEQLD